MTIYKLFILLIGSVPNGGPLRKSKKKVSRSR
jgi:hypothetical protein